MDIKQQFDQLLHRPMTRKEFLTHIGIVIVAIFGMSTILELLFKHRNGTSSGNSGSNRSSYGN